MRIRRLKILNSNPTIYGFDQYMVLGGAIVGLCGLIFFSIPGALIGGLIGSSIGTIISPIINNGSLISVMYWYFPIDFLFKKLPKSEERKWI